MRTLFPILIAVASATAVQAAPPTWASSNMVVLTLRPAVAVHGSMAFVRDAASLEGGTLSVRQRIGALDLLDVPTSPGETVVSRGQIIYRLLLAGLQAHQFRVEGSSSVRVGRVSPPAIIPVSAVTTKPVPADIADRGQGPAAPRLLQDNLGKEKEPPPVLVKYRDIVHMVTYIGELQVVTSGEALEDGRVGQVIRLRNVDSSRMVRGRVVDRAIVEVDFVRSVP